MDLTLERVYTHDKSFEMCFACDRIWSCRGDTVRLTGR